MSSSIVIVGQQATTPSDPRRRALADRIGATMLDTWPENKTGIDVLIVDLAHAKAAQLREQLLQISEASPTARTLLVGHSSTPILELLASTTLGTPILGWIESFESEMFEAKVLAALSESRELKQAAESLTLYHQHNENLQRLSSELEERI
ncbi:MAG: hypothetical protein JNJ49_16230, partial [Bdellovibrionaceae bacterium]|nr:hypothetical protein [Pseudobdellovibrionaceae bacterium]